MIVGRMWSLMGTFLFTVHVPTFFFVSGFFIKSSLGKVGIKQFVRNKSRELLVPFVIWSFILSFWYILIDWVKGSISIIDIIKNASGYFIRAASDMWFLLFLFIGLVFVAILEQIGVTSKIFVPGILVLGFILTGLHNAFVGKVLISILIIWMGRWMSGIGKTSIWAIGTVTLYWLLFSLLGIMNIGIYNGGTGGVAFVLVNLLKIPGALLLPSIFWLIVGDKNEYNKTIIERALKFVGHNTKLFYIIQAIPRAIYTQMYNDKIAIFVMWCILVGGSTAVLVYLLRNVKSVIL